MMSEEMVKVVASGLPWFGFWIFLSVVVVCDHWIFSKGYEGVFLTHRTDSEKELLRLNIEERKLNIERLKKSN